MIDTKILILRSASSSKKKISINF